MHAHGYGSRCSVQWDWGRAGFNAVGIDVRGYGRSAAALPERSRWGSVLTGIGAPETCALRSAVSGYVRGAQVGQRLLAPRRRRTLFYGRSFGGALALMAEGMARLADFPARRRAQLRLSRGPALLRQELSGQESNACLNAYPDRTEDVMLALRDFDTVHFAGLLERPVLLGVGLEGAVVPASTVFAIANHLAGPVEIMEFPVNHTERPAERLWDRFESHWAQLAKQDDWDDFSRTPAGWACA